MLSHATASAAGLAASPPLAQRGACCSITYPASTLNNIVSVQLPRCVQRARDRSSGPLVPFDRRAAGPPTVCLSDAEADCSARIPSKDRTRLPLCEPGLACSGGPSHSPNASRSHAETIALPFPSPTDLPPPPPSCRPPNVPLARAELSVAHSQCGALTRCCSCC